MTEPRYCMTHARYHDGPKCPECPVFTSVSKEVLCNGLHFADTDCNEDAEYIARACNERKDNEQR